jgi:hypothetical protein
MFCLLQRLVKACCAVKDLLPLVASPTGRLHNRMPWLVTCLFYPKTLSAAFPFMPTMAVSHKGKRDALQDCRSSVLSPSDVLPSSMIFFPDA